MARLRARSVPSTGSSALALVALAAAGVAGCSRPAPAPAPAPAAAATPPAAPAAAAEPQPDYANAPGYVRPIGPVATVNGRDIPAALFNAEFDRMLGKGVRVPADRVKAIARNILSRLIDDELRQQVIARERISLTEPEFEAAYKEYTSRFVDIEGRFDEAQFQATLERNRTSIDDLKAQVRREQLARKLATKLGNTHVDDAEMRAFYDQNQSSWIEDESRDVRPILIPVLGSEPEKEAAARVQAEACSRELQAGADFELTAEKFGDKPRAPIHLLRSSPEAELAKAAFELKVGEVSAPIRTRWGFFVVRLIEKSNSRVRPYEEVRDDIRSRLRERKIYLEGLRVVREMRQEAEIFEKLPF